MKITVLTENTSRCNAIGAEHGLSLFIEACGHKILFDAGQTELFARNAELLGIDLSQVDIAVLSHGHYDHSGGMLHFLALNDTAPIYVSRYAFEPHYNGEKYIGVDPMLKESDRLILCGETAEIAPGLTLYSCNSRETPYGVDSGGLSMVQDGQLLPDDFRHEQYLLIEEGGKRVLISGCSHKGIHNIVSWFRPNVLIGGFHLMKKPIGDELINCAEALDQFDTEYYTCHCTGTEQYEAMRRHVRRLHYLSAGECITV